MMPSSAVSPPPEAPSPPSSSPHAAATRASTLIIVNVRTIPALRLILIGPRPPLVRTSQTSSEAFHVVKPRRRLCLADYILCAAQQRLQTQNFPIARSPLQTSVSTEAGAAGHGTMARVDTRNRFISR